MFTQFLNLTMSLLCLLNIHCSILISILLDYIYINRLERFRDSAPHQSPHSYEIHQKQKKGSFQIHVRFEILSFVDVPSPTLFHSQWPMHTFMSGLVAHTLRKAANTHF